MQTVLRRLGRKEYEAVWHDMQLFTQNRNEHTADEIWLVEHPPVYTLGLNGKREHILAIDDIAIVETDRGGQVTYHGPGQVVVYFLLDIERLQWGVRKVVTMLEQAMIQALSQYGITASAKADAPGVYVQGKKIGSIGLRVKRGCCYHGLSINNNMDLKPFDQINTCGFSELDVTQLIDLGVDIKSYELAVPIIHQISQSIK